MLYSKRAVSAFAVFMLGTALSSNTGSLFFQGAAAVPETGLPAIGTVGDAEAELVVPQLPGGMSVQAAVPMTVIYLTDELIMVKTPGDFFKTAGVGPIEPLIETYYRTLLTMVTYSPDGSIIILPDLSDVVRELGEPWRVLIGPQTVESMVAGRTLSNPMVEEITGDVKLIGPVPIKPLTGQVFALETENSCPETFRCDAYPPLPENLQFFVTLYYDLMGLALDVVPINFPVLFLPRTGKFMMNTSLGTFEINGLMMAFSTFLKMPNLWALLVDLTTTIPSSPVRRVPPFDQYSFKSFVIFIGKIEPPIIPPPPLIPLVPARPVPAPGNIVAIIICSVLGGLLLLAFLVLLGIYCYAPQWLSLGRDKSSRRVETRTTRADFAVAEDAAVSKDPWLRGAPRAEGKEEVEVGGYAEAYSKLKDSSYVDPSRRP